LSTRDAIGFLRLRAAGIDEQRARALLGGVSIQMRTPRADAEDSMRTLLASLLAPLFTLLLVFMAVMSSAPYTLHSVIEEKQQRIAEVLLGSMSPFQLMAGKLIGAAGVTLVLGLVYILGGVYAAVSGGQAHLVSVPLLIWFVVFLLAALLMFGAIFVAIGAACSDLKDSQSMMQPVMIFLMLPLLAAPVILRAPHATFSVVLSLIPAWTPFLMLMRLAMTPPPPAWQVALSLVITAATTGALVWAAARIFRVGLLMQGKPPNIPELLRWIRQ
jgi:ABC-type Na+ efflux pump permease subunit